MWNLEDLMDFENWNSKWRITHISKAIIKVKTSRRLSILFKALFMTTQSNPEWRQFRAETTRLPRIHAGLHCNVNMKNQPWTGLKSVWNLARQLSRANLEVWVFFFDGGNLFAFYSFIPRGRESLTSSTKRARLNQWKTAPWKSSIVEHVSQQPFRKLKLKVRAVVRFACSC